MKKNSEYETEKIKEIAKERREWLKSPNGKKKMEEALRRTAEYGEEFRSAYKVNPETLHKQMTI